MPAAAAKVTPWLTCPGPSFVSRRPADNQHSLQQQSTRLRGDAQQAALLPGANARPRGGGGGDSGSALGTLLPVAEVSALITAVPLVLPTAASASSVLAALVPHSLQQHQAWQTVCWGSTAVGAASLLVTLVCTSRFLVS